MGVQSIVKMEGIALPVSAYTLQTLACTAIVLVLGFLLPKINYQVQLSKLPAMGGSGSKHQNAYRESAAKMYKEGYKKFKDSVYRIATSDGT